VTEYEIRIPEVARKSLDEIRAKDKPTFARVLKKIKELAQNPIHPASKPLQGVLQGVRSLRVGRYRVLYEIHDNEVYILLLYVGIRKNKDNDDVYQIFMRYIKNSSR